DLLVLDERGESDHELAERLDGPDPLERRKAVERDAARLELIDHVLHRVQPILEPLGLGILAHDLEQSVALHPIEVDPPADRVAEELLTALLERQQETAFSNVGATVEKLGDRKRLARSRRAGDQNHRIAKEASAAHQVELRIARRNANVGR